MYEGGLPLQIKLHHAVYVFNDEHMESQATLRSTKNWRVKIFFVSIPPKSNAISTYTEKTLA
jgi:hypothetical protein